MKPPTIIGATSFTTSTSTGRVEREMHGAAHARIVERLLLGVQPGALDHALVEVGGGHARRRLRLARRDRIDDARVVHAARRTAEPSSGENGRP